MMKANVYLESVKGEKTYRFTCDPQSPLGEAYDVICEFQNFIIERMKEELKKQEANREEKIEAV